jgi:hypothetical protein
LRSITPVWRVLEERALTLRKLSTRNAARILARRAEEKL